MHQTEGGIIDFAVDNKFLMNPTGRTSERGFDRRNVVRGRETERQNENESVRAR